MHFNVRGTTLLPIYVVYQYIVIFAACVLPRHVQGLGAVLSKRYHVKKLLGSGPTHHILSYCHSLRCCFCGVFTAIFPSLLAEAKLAREKRDAHYPTPEEPKSCVVCRQVTATIACMECPNKICQACVTRECLEKEKSFLYFHHQHCLRCGMMKGRTLLHAGRFWAVPINPASTVW